MEVVNKDVPNIGINYNTPENTKVSFWGKYFPTITFYINSLIRVVEPANRQAKKGEYTTARWVGNSLEILRCVEYSGGKVVVEGMEDYTSTQGPCVFVANHMSTLETFALPILIQPFKDVTYIVKKSLSTYPFFGAIMRSRSPILLERVNPREDFAKSMTEGVEILNSGRSLIIFPQATRKPFLEQDFNSLGVKIAKKANVPVVPIALKTDFWATGWPIKDFGFIYPKRIVHFAFGKAMKIEGSGKEEHAECLRHISSKLAEWKEEENNS